MDTSSPGASSSQDHRLALGNNSDKRTLEDAHDDDEMPEKSQKISSVCIEFGASGKRGESPCLKSYEQDLIDLVKEYEERHEQGETFVHVRKRYSGNRDLRTLRELTEGEQFYTVN